MAAWALHLRLGDAAPGSVMGRTQGRKKEPLPAEATMLRPLPGQAIKSSAMVKKQTKKNRTKQKTYESNTSNTNSENIWL